ncbi:Ig-like domain-containing protein [Acidipila rosea]|uniref:Ig-like domain-containing protein n=1 Tax=Acidipila rosea TaxID=768535 RepID=A0A4R1L9V2_9BACT|nr:Ig-like domain-containing protein [Acidipila rosea]
MMKRDSVSAPASWLLRQKIVSLLALGLWLVIGLGGSARLNAQGVTSFSGMTPVGTSAAAQMVPVTIATAGSVASVEVLTLGAPGLDYSDAGGGTCSIGNSYTVGQSCTVVVGFTPRYPGQRAGAVVLLDASNQVLGTQFLNGIGQGAVAVMVPGTISTIAGDGQFVSVYDGKVATQADLELPSSVAADGLGNLYIADSKHNRIRKVDAKTQIISTFAGDGSAGYSGDGGSAASAALNLPSSIFIDGAGNLYIADSGNNVIRKVTPSTGIITTIAGNNTPGFTGDAGLATAAELNTPMGITADSAGNLYIADTLNQRIRKVDAMTGIIKTIAGNGYNDGNGHGGYSGDGGAATSAKLNLPYAVTFDLIGNLYIPDSGNNRIRKVNSSGIITTVAGNGTQGYSGDGGTAVAAELYSPSSVAFDVAGDMYIADTQNYRVRKVSAATGSIETIAGNGSGGGGNGYVGDGASATAAVVYGPYGVFLDQAGNLDIADYFNQRIRQVSSSIAVLKFTPALRQGQTSSTISQAIENDGNAPLTFSSIVPDSNAAVDGTTTTCSLSTTLSIDGGCQIGARFAPSQAGNPVIGNINIAGDPANAPLDIMVEGQALTLNTATVSLVSTPNPSTFGQAVSFSVSVTSGAGIPTGTVTFKEGTTTLATQTLNSGSASFTTSTLSVGVHSIIANYGGDTDHGPSQSVAVNQTVQGSTTVKLASSGNPSTVNTAVTFTATVLSSNGGTTPTGTVIFYDGGAVIGNGTLSPGGIATYTTTSLVPGPHAITASYGGDATDLSATSPVLSETVQQQTTSTVVTSSLHPSSFDSAVTFTATVTVTGTGPATGTVTFKDGSTVLGTGALNGSGQATFTSSALGVGVHSVIAVYGGDKNDSTSTSAALTQTVQQVTTSTTLSSSANPGNAGAAITFAAHVTGVVGVPLTGTVTFKDGATTLGVQPLSNTGAASFSTSALSVSTHNVTAVYSGDADNSGSTSTAVPEKIQQATTNTVVASNANPGIFGTTVAFTATVTGNGGTPTGSVTFKDGAATLGTAQLTNGSTSLSAKTLAVGPHSITAVYSGDTNDVASTSPVVSEVIKQATTTVALNVSPNPSTAGNAVVLSASVSGNGGVPTGTVTFKDGSTILGTQTLNGSGSAALTASGLGVGPHVLIAVYSGDTGDLGSTSTTVSDSVQQVTSKTVLSASPKPSPAGGTVYLTAVVTGDAPTGTVTFKDGANAIGTGAVGTGGIASLSLSTLSVGQHTLTATYAGDGNNSASTSASIGEDVQQNTQVAVVPSANPAYAGASVTFTTSLTGTTPNPTGNMTLKDGASVLATAALNGSRTVNFLVRTLSPATHSITATYSGDSNNAGGTSPILTENVLQAITTTGLAVSSNSPIAGTQLTLTATVSGNGGSAGGTVTFKDGSVILGTRSLVNGSASLPVSAIAAGQHNFIATYSGDTNDQGSTSPAMSISALKASTTTVVTSSASTSNAGAQVIFTATVTGSGGAPGGTVSFKDGSAVLGSSTLRNGSAQIAISSLAIGSHAITAIYAGDANDGGSSSSPITQMVQQAASKLTLQSSLNPSGVGARVTFTATLASNGSIPTGTVVFEDGATVLGAGSVNGSGLASYSTTALATGQHSVTANYSGDANNGASVSAPINQIVQQNTTTSLTANKTVTLGGTPLSLTASVVGANGSHQLSGSVTFKNGAATLGSPTLNASGVAVLNTSTLPVGQESITATYSGDTTDLGSLSAPLIETVQQAATKAVVSSSGNPSLLGSSVTFTVSVAGSGVTPTGTVTLRDGAAALGTASLNGNGLALFSTSSLTVGSHDITAIYSGDTDNTAATSAVFTQTIQQQTAITVTASANPALATSGITFTANVRNTAGTPLTGTVIFRDGATVLSTQNLSNGAATYATTALTVGSHDITAVYSGDTFDAGSTSSALSEAVQSIPTTISLGASSSTITTDQQLTLIAKVASSLGNVPSGIVTYRSGTSVIGTAAINNAGVATLSPSLSPGTYTITASYSGDSIDAVSVSGTVTVTVTEATDFSVVINPTAISVQANQNATVAINLQSTAGFAGQIGLGCASLPQAATCTFSKDTVKLAANGTQTVQLTVDTGSPLTSGGVARNSMPGSTAPLSLAWIFPGGVLLGWITLRARKKGSNLQSWLLMLVIAAAASALPGCASLHMTGTPPGSYTFQVITTAVNTGINHTTNVTLTVK